MCRALPLLMVPLAGAALAAKPDSSIYPNANIYRDPVITETQGGYAKVLREFCSGGGRGQVHFLSLDGQSIRVPRTWPTYLELAPGRHRLGMEFIGTADSIWGSWQGAGEVSGELEAGKAYVVRYQRTAVDGFQLWLEPITDFDNVGMSTVICRHGEFPDKAYHQ